MARLVIHQAAVSCFLTSLIALKVFKPCIAENTVTGTSKGDILIGKEGKDKIYGLQGADIIYPRAGKDTIYTGPGADTVYAVDNATDTIIPGTSYTSDIENTEILFVDKKDKIQLPKADSGTYKKTKITETINGTQYTGTLYEGGKSKRYKVFNGQGDPHFTGYDGSHYDFHGYDGGVFNIFTEAVHQVNAQFVDYGAPYNGTWMRAFGIRYGTSFHINAGLQLGDEFQPQQVTDGLGMVRMVVPRALHQVIDVHCSGVEHASNYLFSGKSLVVSGDVLLYFPPAAQVVGDAAEDGPFLVMRTPDMEVTLFFETEGVLHLDISVTLLSANMSDVHGVLGQSAHWEGGNHRFVEGSEEQYAVKGGLLGTDFAFNLFKGNKPTSSREVHRKLFDGPSLRHNLLCMNGKTAGSGHQWD